MSDHVISQVRGRDYQCGYRHTRDRIEMLRVLRLVGRSIWNGRRFAAAELIHRSVPRTVCAAARRRGTGHPGRRTHAERKQQSDKNYG